MFSLDQSEFLCTEILLFFFFHSKRGIFLFQRKKVKSGLTLFQSKNYLSGVLNPS